MSLLVGCMGCWWGNSMKISEIISILNTMPQDKKLWHVCDGNARTTIDGIYLARNGEVVSFPEHERVYDEEFRPADAPGDKEDPYWRPTLTTNPPRE